EIVSEPDLRSPAEASAYLKVIRQIARYLGVSDGNMEEGSLRCDANISLRPVGQIKFGTRTEIKNLNSFKFVERALEYEIARQLSLLKNGKEVVQETLLFDSASGTTRTLRTKEQAADYRYFPDPDLPPLIIEDSWIAAIRSKMPKLPHARAKELVDSLGLSAYDAGVLTAEREAADYFDALYGGCHNAKAACNWLTSELFGMLNKTGKSILQSPISAQHLAELIRLIDAETISGKIAKQVFEEMFASGKHPEQIIAEKGLKQITSEEEITKIVLDVLEKSPGQIQDYLSGKDALFGFFVGQIMKASKGAANPKKVNEILSAELAKRKGA
ncbi:MAG: Asp-tRNA(Asn)/Glu-tRNA(Gln) amidotransferase subunit GatB, partial [Proteobacteria bacterium]|nr:Asp-tRNA(Asn)/Glu-tRNA(Gln) amidotransferase subunit GatB [Pseudomonadota bacterium]